MVLYGFYECFGLSRMIFEAFGPNVPFGKYNICYKRFSMVLEVKSKRMGFFGLGKGE